MFNGSSLEETGLENPLAVYIRNLPTLLLNEEKFKTLISNWRGVDSDKSCCFANKKNSAWNGWAFVHFKSEVERHDFLEDENQHYVRDSAGTVHKLKVTKWFKKGSISSSSKSVSNTSKTLPLYNVDLSLDRELKLEDFERKCNESSIQSFRGSIHSYVTDIEGLGHNGFLEVKLTYQSKNIKELILFHSDSFWLCLAHYNCYGAPECVKRCGTDNFLPIRLKVGSEVVFTARKIPQGILDSCHFQAKSIWRGEDSQPNYVSSPSSIKLDEYLEDYLRQTETPQTTEKSPTPLADTAQPVQISPTPPSNLRQKPLQGSLKQLNSSLDKSISFKVHKKVAPTNFAQAVAAVPVVEVSETADVVEKGKVESFPTLDEVVVLIPGYGRFILDDRHFETSIKSLKPSLKVESSLVVALRHDKSSGKKSKYDVIRAFPETNNIIKPSENEGGLDDLLTTGDSNESIHSRGESNYEINLEELDKYYDTFPQISEFLQREVPIILPNIAPSSNIIERLANEIIYTHDESNEVNILESFFKSHSVSSSFISKFIADFLKFRKSQQLSHFVPEEPVVRTNNLSEEVSADISRFLDWMKNTPEQTDKIDLYNEFFKFAGAVLVWHTKLVNPALDNNVSFLTKKNIGEPDYSKIQTWITSKGLNLDKVMCTLEEDTFKFILDSLNENETIDAIRDETCGDVKIFASLKLTELEGEFVECKDKDRETHTFILRALIILRKTRVTLEELISMHKEHLMVFGKSRNKEFSNQIQMFLTKKADQKFLDETNTFIKNNKDLRLKEHTPASCKKIDKYIPLLTTCLCGFIFKKANLSPRCNGFMERSPQRVAKPNVTPGTGFDSLLKYMLSTNQVESFDSLILTLQNQNVTMKMLENLFNTCRGQGVLKWNFQINKLHLNPPLGLSLFKIGEILWDFMNFTLDKSDKRPTEKKARELMPKIPQQLLTCYDSPEVTSILQGVEEGDLDLALREGSEIVDKLRSFWTDPRENVNEHFVPLAAVVWNDSNVDDQLLESNIQQFYSKYIFDENCVPHLQELLSKWANILERSKTFKYNTLAVFNMLKLTLASFDPNIYEEIQDGSKHIHDKVFKNLINEQNLYSGEGIIIGTLGSFILVQTRYCRVLAHPTVVFTKQNPGMNTEQTIQCLEPFSHVRVHSKPVRNTEGKTVCHIALLVWETPIDMKRFSSNEPPKTGILLPFDQSFYDNVRIALRQETMYFDMELSEFGTDAQLQLYMNILKGLQEAKVGFVLYSLDYIEKQIFENKLCSEIDYLMPNTTKENPLEFVTKVKKQISRSDDVKKMLMYYNLIREEHDSSKALEMFLEKYPSDFYPKVGANKNNCTEPPTYTDFNTQPIVQTVSIEKEMSDSNYRHMTELKFERLNTAVETLFLLVQDSQALMLRMEKRFQSLEKGRSTVSKDETGERSYVRVWREEDGEIEEVPTNPEGLLPLTTLRAIYHGTAGMKYRLSGAQKTWRSLVLEKELFYPPEDGWGDRVYLASFPTGTAYGYPGSGNIMGNQLPIGAPHRSGLNNSALSSLSQLLVRQPSASIWGSSPAPILGGISPVSLDFQDPHGYGLHSSQMP